jgi:MoxR-like ATPase
MEALGSDHLLYKGDQLATAQETSEGILLNPYLPSEELVEAVNLAILLERPLLLKGEPGCGKTQLARAVAYELNLPYQSWYIKSTSQAKDGLYSYDAVGRLRDAQLAASGIQDEGTNRAKDPSAYVRFEQLGQAFLNSQRAVLLIDEIDKADIDFPNDLLRELDEQAFRIEETGKEIRANHPPIVFITSNDEKDLPDAFLRRCLVHYVQFPDRDRLVQILCARFPDASVEVMQKAIERFQDLRESMRLDRGEAGKKVSTSELIDWFRVLSLHPEDEALQKLGGKLPYYQVLLKNWEDHENYLKG